MVEVFKTNVYEEQQSALLVEKLLYHYPHWRINFDLEDCDKILRVEGDSICNEKIIEFLNAIGFECTVLN